MFYYMFPFLIYSIAEVDRRALVPMNDSGRCLQETLFQAFIESFKGSMKWLLSEIQKVDAAAYYLSVDSLTLILRHSYIRERGNEAAHTASDALKAAPLISEVDGLSEQMRDYIRNIYIYVITTGAATQTLCQNLKLSVILQHVAWRINNKSLAGRIWRRVTRDM